MISSKGEAAGSGIMYFVFFVMAAIIIAGIFGGLVAFFGKGYDYRESEARALLKDVRECFDREGFDLTKLDKVVFFDKCKISSKVIEDGNHFVYVKDKVGKEFSVGVTDFSVRCGLNARFKNKGMPLCARYGSNADKYEFLIGSSQNSKRVAA